MPIEYTHNSGIKNEIKNALPVLLKPKTSDLDMNNKSKNLMFIALNQIDWDKIVQDIIKSVNKIINI